MDQGVYMGVPHKARGICLQGTYIYIYIYIYIYRKVRKVRGTILGVPMIRSKIYWRVFWGPLFRETTICMQEYKVPDLFWRLSCMKNRCSLGQPAQLMADLTSSSRSAPLLSLGVPCLVLGLLHSVFRV